MFKHFYTKSLKERRQILEADGASDLKELAGIPNAEFDILDRMSENVIGAWRLPLGVVPQLTVNGKCHRIAMSTEEPSVIAAVNRTSRLINACHGGIHCRYDSPVTMAQISGTLPLAQANGFKLMLIRNKERWLTLANEQNPKLVELGGGAFDIQVDVLPPEWNDSWRETFIILKIYVHTMDAMGANAVNTMAEALLRCIENENINLTPCMAIVSNASEGRLVHAHIEIPFATLEEITGIPGSNFAMLIARGSALADRCPERAVTHNKGILNGIIAAAIPLGQDTRAINAAFYDYACKTGVHLPLVRWNIQKQSLHAEMHLPLPVGFVGGLRKVPAVNAAFAFDKIENYAELCGVLAGVGMAQNLGALWALTTEGIQAGHMKLHARK
ncbi:MAG: 3-hydroxy-3-methylglutaryl-CoA reductase [Proteobacteria bacterium]|nr:3-hydroxy-3-methylglutaryl-CoA reductase [Pseudomonadota bacterium]